MGLGGWRRAVDLLSAAGGRGDPALGWAAQRKEEDREKCEVQRTRQTLSRALTPGCHRCVVRAVSISSALSGDCLHKKSPGGSCENPTDGGMGRRGAKVEGREMVGLSHGLLKFGSINSSEIRYMPAMK